MISYIACFKCMYGDHTNPPHPHTSALNQFYILKLQRTSSVLCVFSKLLRLINPNSNLLYVYVSLYIYIYIYRYIYIYIYICIYIYVSLSLSLHIYIYIHVYKLNRSGGGRVGLCGPTCMFQCDF